MNLLEPTPPPGHSSHPIWEIGANCKPAPPRIELGEAVFMDFAHLWINPITGRISHTPGQALEPLLETGCLPGLSARRTGEHFLAEYFEYCRVNFVDALNYAQLLVEIGRDGASKLETQPNALVLIPSRNEVCTSRAVEVISEDFRTSGLRPLTIILHNFVEQPSTEVAEDLALLRDQPDIWLIDAHVSYEFTIGEARALLANVALDLNCLLALGRREEQFTPLPLVFADADITDVLTGTYEEMVTPIQDNHGIQMVGGPCYDDPSSVASDRSMACRLEFIRRSEIWREEILESGRGKCGTGALTALSPYALMDIGGVPLASVGEDLLLSSKYANLNPSGFVQLPFSAGHVGVRADRAIAAAYEYLATAGCLNFMARYYEWDQIANLERPEIGPRELDPLLAADILNTELHFFCGDIASNWAGIARGAVRERVQCVITKMESFLEEFGLTEGTEEGFVNLGLVRDVVKFLNGEPTQYLTIRRAN